MELLFVKWERIQVEYFTKITGEKLKESTSSRYKNSMGYSNYKPIDYLGVYGADRISQSKKLQDENSPEWNEPLHPKYPFTQAEAQFCASRNEMAMKVEECV